MPFLMSPSAFGGWAPAGSPPSGVLRTFPGPVGDARVSGPARPLGASGVRPSDRRRFVPVSPRTAIAPSRTP